MNIKKYFKVFGILTLSVFALAGCRDEEQGRVLQYDPGVYKGKTDTNLTEEQRRILRQRSLYQGKGNETGGAGGTRVSKQRDVRKPQDDRAARAALKARTKLQSGSGN